RRARNRSRQRTDDRLVQGSGRERLLGRRGPTSELAATGPRAAWTVAPIGARRRRPIERDRDFAHADRPLATPAPGRRHPHRALQPRTRAPTSSAPPKPIKTTWTSLIAQAEGRGTFSRKLLLRRYRNHARRSAKIPVRRTRRPAISSS